MLHLDKKSTFENKWHHTELGLVNIHIAEEIEGLKDCRGPLYSQQHKGITWNSETFQPNSTKHSTNRHTHKKGEKASWRINPMSHDSLQTRQGPSELSSTCSWRIFPMPSEQGHQKLGSAGDPALHSALICWPEVIWVSSCSGKQDCTKSESISEH